MNANAPMKKPRLHQYEFRHVKEFKALLIDCTAFTAGPRCTPSTEVLEGSGERPCPMTRFRVLFVRSCLPTINDGQSTFDSRPSGRPTSLIKPSRQARCYCVCRPITMLFCCWTLRHIFLLPAVVLVPCYEPNRLSGVSILSRLTCKGVELVNR